MHIRKKHIVALLFCTALLFTQPAAPLLVFAALDEEDGGYAGEGSADISESGDAADDTQDEPAATTYSDTVSTTIQDLENQIQSKNSELESIQNQQKQIQSQIDSAKTEKERAEQERNNVGYQITLTQDEIAGLAERIELLEEKIDLKQKEIWQKQDEIDVKYEQFKLRIRAKYMQDNGTALGLLVGTDSFSDFLTATEYTARVAEYDRSLMTDLTAQREGLEQDKEELAADKATVEADKTQTEMKKQDLSQQYKVAETQVHSYQEMEQAFLADLEKNKAMQSQMKAEIDSLYQKIEFSKNPYVGGEMAWPLPGYYNISSYYGSRFGGSDFHTGTDLFGAGCRGASVVAANDGVIAFVNTSYVQGSGYGKYIMVDHGVNDQGQSVTTLYAHLDGVSVSVNQKVKKGEHIGACGSTGWSTGPHLHFEVRLNGQWVNSLPYIQG